MVLHINFSHSLSNLFLILSVNKETTKYSCIILFVVEQPLVIFAGGVYLPQAAGFVQFSRVVKPVFVIV